MLKLIAHRGASADAPENTISAIQQAFQIGVDCIEIDVRLSKDGVPVIIHDPTISRTTNSPVTKKVEELTLDQLKQLDAGSWFGKKFIGEKVPTLDEILNLDFGKTALMLEIKQSSTAAAKAVETILNTVRKHQSIPSLAMGSFSPEIVSEIQRQASQEFLATGIVEKNHLIDQFKGRNLKRLAIEYQLLHPRLIQEFHEEGTEVWAFTVDDVAVTRFLLSIHIDGIITNVPQTLKFLQ